MYEKPLNSQKTVNLLEVITKQVFGDEETKTEKPNVDIKVNLSAQKQRTITS